MHEQQCHYRHIVLASDMVRFGISNQITAQISPKKNQNKNNRKNRLFCCFPLPLSPSPTKATTFEPRRNIFAAAHTFPPNFRPPSPPHRTATAACLLWALATPPPQQLARVFPDCGSKLVIGGEARGFSRTGGGGGGGGTFPDANCPGSPACVFLAWGVGLRNGGRRAGAASPGPVPIPLNLVDGCICERQEEG